MTAPTDETPQTDDWWDRLYAEADTVSAAKSAPPPRAVVGRVRGRLPDWWEKKSEDLPEADQQLADDDAQDDDHVVEPGDDEPVTEEEESADDGDTPESSTEKTEEGSDGRWFRPPPPDYWPSLPDLPARPTISDRTRRLLYNVGAGVVGYIYGPTDTFGRWIESCGRDYSISGALVLGAGLCAVTAIWDSRTRHWRAGLHWFARIPLASAITALALYAPASQL
ncbi:hypothetical protein [Streptomyces sp. NPDC020141]|uniref:hypothetical protein n=1 Tax=Streptomyces sp. NPDC020141 TaxID=3365065 RepID=UPI00378BEFE8